MSLENELKKGIINHLKRENKKIVRYNKDYSFANEFYNKSERGRNKVIKQINENFKNDENLRNKLIEMLEDSQVNSENEEIKRKFSRKSLDIGMIVNDNKGIYLPINVETRTLLEKDVLDYISSLTRNIDKNVEQGNLEDFVSFSLNNANNLIFNEVPEIFNLANITFSKNNIIVPINDIYGKIEQVLEESVSFPFTEEDVRHIRMTPHSKMKKYIPLRKNENTPDFFPRLNMPFIIQYGNGEYFATLSSRSEIHNTNDDLGAMKKMFEDMNISEDSILKVTNLESEVYLVELLNNDNNPVSSPVDNSVSFPVGGNDYGFRDIGMTTSAIKYEHIPLRATDGPKIFFPGYKVPFTIEYFDKNFLVKVNSNDRNGSGNYISNTQDNPGAMSEMFKDMDLTEKTTTKTATTNKATTKTVTLGKVMIRKATIRKATIGMVSTKMVFIKKLV